MQEAIAQRCTKPRTERGIVADNVLQIESRLLWDNTGSLERRDSHE